MENTLRKIISWLLVLCVIALTSTLMLLADTDAKSVGSVKYETTFQESMSISIDMDESEWKDMIENPLEEKYHAANITINGTTIYGVGIRTKGNSSLTSVANSDSDRYSFKVKFDEYIGDQTYLGMDMLVLNNMYADNTYFKEYISFNMMEYIGIDTPLYNYANISINGEVWGTYFALESYDESYLYRTTGNTDGNLYNVKSVDGAGMGNGQTLSYIDDEASSYASIFENSVSKVSGSDKKTLINILKQLSDKENLEDILDVDEIIRYFAVHNFLVNMDSYTSNMGQNFYLLEDEGVLSILPWDYNLAFGGFGSSDINSMINYSIDEPVQSVSVEDLPLLNFILENEEYKERYYLYLNEIVEGYVNSGVMESTVLEAYAAISTNIEQENVSFVDSDTQYEAMLDLIEVAKLRAQAVSNQINQDSTLVTTTEINLNDLGSQGGSMNRDNMMRNTQSIEDIEVPTPEGEEGMGSFTPPNMDGEIPQDGEMPTRPDFDNSEDVPEGVPNESGDNSNIQHPAGDNSVDNRPEQNTENQEDRPSFGGEGKNGPGNMMEGNVSTQSSWEWLYYLGASLLMLSIGYIVVIRKKTFFV